MKLILAVIRDKDANAAADALGRARIGVTKLASTGGFLRDGNTTLLVGVEDGRVEAVMDILKENCAKRTETEIVMPHGTGGIPAWRMGGTPVKVEVGGATVFVLEGEEFRKL